MQQREPRPGLEPQAAAATTKPLHMRPALPTKLDGAPDPPFLTLINRK